MGVRAFQQDRHWHWALPDTPEAAEASTSDVPAASDVLTSKRTSVSRSEPATAAVSDVPSHVAKAPSNVDQTMPVVLGWAAEVSRLDPNRPPHGVPMLRWRSFIADAAAFVQSTWAARAVLLGWSERAQAAA